MWGSDLSEPRSLMTLVNIAVEIHDFRAAIRLREQNTRVIHCIRTMDLLGSSRNDGLCTLIIAKKK